MVDVKVTNQKLMKRAIAAGAAIGRCKRSSERGNLLDASDNEVKTAVVMQRKGIGAAQARQILEQAGGQIARRHRRCRLIVAHLPSQSTG